MPRSPRVVVPQRPHHVVVRGNNRRRLFSNATDFLTFLRYMRDAIRKGDCDVHAIVLMPNHVHLLITPRSEDSLAAFMKNVCQRFAQYRNSTRAGSGKVFEERFFSLPLKNDNHFGCCLAYMDLNPVRAGLAKRPGEYAWSTYGVLAREEERSTTRWARAFADLIVRPAWYENLATCPALRAHRYRKWVELCRERDVRPDHSRVLDAAEKQRGLDGPRVRRPDRKTAA